jgi:Cu/Ag efflux pump CusA
MIRWIVGSSLKPRGVVLVLAAAVLLFGATQLRKMPVDALPEFAPPTVEVQTEALGLSAAEVEELITVPLEQDLLCGSPTGRSSAPAGLSTPPTSAWGSATSCPSSPPTTWPR